MTTRGEDDMTRDVEGRVALPLWPARRYAEGCRLGEWVGYEPREIAVEELTREILPHLGRRGVRAAVFSTPGRPGELLSVYDVVEALRHEQLRDEPPPYRCPCCEQRTLPEPPPGTYHICEVCHWQSDPIQDADPGYAGGANVVSMTEARANVAAYGTSDPKNRPPR